MPNFLTLQGMVKELCNYKVLKMGQKICTLTWRVFTEPVTYVLFSASQCVVTDFMIRKKHRRLAGNLRYNLLYNLVITSFDTVSCDLIAPTSVLCMGGGNPPPAPTPTAARCCVKLSSFKHPSGSAHEKNIIINATMDPHAMQ